MRLLIAMFFAFLLPAQSVSGSGGEFEDELKMLKRQVEILVERRSEDLKSIEESVRRSVYEGAGVVQLRKEIEKLRFDLERSRSGKPTPTDKNDVVTVKWLYNMATELKTELAEIQEVLNSSTILKEREETRSRLDLIGSDVSNLNSETEEGRRRSAKYEADLQVLGGELKALKGDVREVAVACGRTKNQLKALQMDWNQNWQILNEKSPNLDNEISAHPSRHQRVIKQHVVRLEKTSKALFKENHRLRDKIEEMDEELIKLRAELRSQKTTTEEMKRKTDEGIANATKVLDSNTESIRNMTGQLGNYDRLHLSLLELLEDVESIEARVEKDFPEFRKEVSKLEVQVQEAASGVSTLKEDQRNVVDSLKAISFTVSSMQDKGGEGEKRLKAIEGVVDGLIKSTTIHNSKLHHHILQEESGTGTLDSNATKATIHLVEELRSFESEYKSIVNKLPSDCSTVDGPPGLYLISPGDGPPILARCRDGWTTLQRRYDGSVDFNRNWEEYANGFGSATGEHWLGNANLHLLTRSNCSELRVDMRDIYGRYWSARYEDFRVGGREGGFRLHVSRYGGNASDALDYQNGMEFSAIDNDRDISNTHCASNYEGGWWFSHCQHANLNGRYNLGLTWFDSSRNEWIAVADSEMKVKRRDVC